MEQDKASVIASEKDLVAEEVNDEEEQKQR